MQERGVQDDYLVIDLEDPLEDPNDYARHEADPLFDGRSLTPSWSPNLRIKEPLIEHLAKDVILDLGFVAMENFR